MSLTLFVICAIAAGSLAFVYGITKSKIAKQAETEKMEAVKFVMPEADRFEDMGNGKWVAYKDKKKIGFVVEAGIQGYGGPIKIIFGTDIKKTVKKIKIIEQTETPGLGAKIKEPKFSGQFEGKSAKEIILKKDNPGEGRIDAISGATISSRAVTNAIREALKEIK